MLSNDISYGDPRPEARIRDPDLLRLMHGERERECVLSCEIARLELHHILPRSQRGDDVRANLVWLTAEWHRRITANDPDARELLGRFIVAEKPEFFYYLAGKLGSKVKARDWMRRRLLVECLLP